MARAKASGGEGQAGQVAEQSQGGVSRSLCYDKGGGWGHIIKGFEGHSKGLGFYSKWSGFEVGELEEWSLVKPYLPNAGNTSS